jgi:phosphonate transport system substrate-binding protein
MNRNFLHRRNGFVTVTALCVALGLTLLSGCGGSSNAADSRYGLSELVIVLLPGEESPETAQVKNVFDQDLSAAIGLPVKEYHATDYTAVVEAMRTGEAQVAMFGPFSYVHAVDRSDAECFVTTATNGQSGYYSHIIVRSDSDIQTLEDLRGRTFAFVDPESTSGNVVPSNEIMNAMPDLGLTFDELHVNGKFFESVIFAGTHPNAVQAVAKGDVDAASVTSATVDLEIRNGNIDEGALRVIHISPLIPSSPYAYHKDLSDELKAKLREFFLSYDSKDYFTGLYGERGATMTFVEAKDSDYEYVRELRDKFGLTD